MSATLQQLVPASVPGDAPPPGPNETPWFDGQQLPAQVGVYQRLSIANLVMYSFFDGAHWLWNYRTAEAAARVHASELSLIQTLPWRGLKAPPPAGYGPVSSLPASRSDSDSEGGEPC